MLMNTFVSHGSCTPWRGPYESYGPEFKKEVISMTRVIAAHDNHKLLVGSDTLWLGVNGQRDFFAPKIIGNDNVIIAFFRQH